MRIICDDCGKKKTPSVLVSDKVPALRKKAKEAGFKRKNGKDYCGFCIWQRERH